MPVQYDLPEYTGANTVEDVNKFNKLPFYLAMNESKMFSQWQVYNQLFGKISWQPNMGPILRGVSAEPTPVGQALFFPVDVTATPNKSVYETLESKEDATLKQHDFDSNQFHFLPSFQDFRENQLDFNHKDIVRQITVTNDLFIRTYGWAKAFNVFVCGNKGNSANLGKGQLVNAPYNTDNNITAANITKNAAWLQDVIANVGTNLTLAAIDYACAVLRDDVGSPFFEGTVNTPRENELIKGKYVLIGSSEAYQMFKWDPNFSQFRNVNLAYVSEGFRGSIFDEITYKTERYPLRIAADGTIPIPETWNNVDNRTYPNRAYVNAPYEVAIMVGADPYKTVKVGPPPRAFSSKKMSMDKFYSMRWNGEVTLTDQVLVKYSDGSYDTNVRGRFLKLISSLIFGLIGCNPRSYMPIVFARKRPQVI